MLLELPAQKRKSNKLVAMYHVSPTLHEINKNPDLRATHSVDKQIAEGVAAEVN